MNRFVSRTSPSLSAGTAQLRALRAGTLFFNEDDGAGGGSGEGEGERSKRSSASEILNRYNGDTVRMAEKCADLEGDNYKLRGKRDVLQRKVDELTPKVPVEGTVVLTKEQAEDWNAYQTLLKECELVKAADVKKALDAAKESAEKVTKLEGDIAAKDRGLVLRDVAADMGWKVGVLTERDELTPGLSYEKKTVTKDGKAESVWHVKYKDGEGEGAPVKEQPLSEFAASHAKWKDYGPALQAQQEQGSTGALGGALGGTLAGTRVADQGSGGSGSAGTLFQSIRDNAAAKQKEQSGSQGPSLEERMNMAPVRGA